MVLGTGLARAARHRSASVSQVVRRIRAMNPMPSGDRLADRVLAYGRPRVGALLPHDPCRGRAATWGRPYAGRG